MRNAIYDVTVVKDVRVPMRDGVELVADLFTPVTDEPLPVVLEYLPYRKDDLTVPGHVSHYYFARRGYVSVQMDARGTGGSPGVSLDEYTQQEQDDGYDAVEWLAAQEWCSGAVGAFGISYGGYTSCQLAANNPPHLKAIAPMHGFDDHYSDDCHYGGGQLRTYDIGRYGNRMLATNALPPHPAGVGADWASFWRERLERSESWLVEWLRHQQDGPYWWTGSVRDRVHEIECAVLLWGGWQDGYVNSVLRMFPALRCPKRAIIGPWMHARPDTAIPGPQVDWLGETVRWWDQWLKNEDTGVLGEPPVVVYMQRFDRPSSGRRHTSGYWRQEDDLPVAGAEPLVLHLGDHGRLGTGPDAEQGVDHLTYKATTGTSGGEFSAGGLATFGLPLDQRPDEAFSLVYTSDVLTEPLEIVGRPRLTLHAGSSAPVALFSAKLCAVAPDGTSTLVCKGALNATRRRSLADPQPLDPGTVYELQIELNATAWRFEPGYRIRLAISNADFPSLWPTPELATSTVSRGAERSSHLTLPVVAPGDPDGGFEPFGPFEVESLPGLRDVLRDTYQDVVHHVLEDSVETRYGFVSEQQLPDGVTVVDERAMTMTVSDSDPASARGTGHVVLRLKTQLWTADVTAHTIVGSTATTFDIVQMLRVELDGSVFFTRTWAESIPRLLM